LLILTENGSLTPKTSGFCYSNTADYFEVSLQQIARTLTGYVPPEEGNYLFELVITLFLRA
jgi:hypothetical protein